MTPPIDASNALDLSESEDEEELEDIVEDFTFKADVADGTVRIQLQLARSHTHSGSSQPSKIDYTSSNYHTRSPSSCNLLPSMGWT